MLVLDMMHTGLFLFLRSHAHSGLFTLVLDSVHIGSIPLLQSLSCSGSPMLLLGLAWMGLRFLPASHRRHAFRQLIIAPEFCKARLCPVGFRLFSFRFTDVTPKPRSLGLALAFVGCELYGAASTGLGLRYF